MLTCTVRQIAFARILTSAKSHNPAAGEEEENKESTEQEKQEEENEDAEKGEEAAEEAGPVVDALAIGSEPQADGDTQQTAVTPPEEDEVQEALLVYINFYKPFSRQHLLVDKNRIPLIPKPNRAGIV